MQIPTRDVLVVTFEFKSESGDGGSGGGVNGTTGEGMDQKQNITALVNFTDLLDKFPEDDVEEFEDQVNIVTERIDDGFDSVDEEQLRTLLINMMRRILIKDSAIVKNVEFKMRATSQ